MTDGQVCCDRVSWIANEYAGSYHWMSEQLTKRVGPAPVGVEFPIWAWYQFHSKKKPMPTLNPDILGSGIAKSILMVLEVPDDKVLLSDFILWNSVMSQVEIVPRKDPLIKKLDKLDADAGRHLFFEDLPSDIQQEIRETWVRVFDLNHRDPYYQPKAKRNRSIQAVFWSLKKEYVRKVYSLELKGKNIVREEIR